MPFALLRQSSSAAYLCSVSRFIHFVSLSLRESSSPFISAASISPGCYIGRACESLRLRMGGSFPFYPLLYRCFKKQTKPPILRVFNIAAQMIHLVNLSLRSTSAQLAASSTLFQTLNGSIFNN
ncbi:MAG TPA: hypothetical protein VKC90_10840 [Chitinophagaceae bacterium]|nr:hypothetical protein [Chitinophagaceae bacterium]